MSPGAKAARVQASATVSPLPGTRRARTLDAGTAAAAIAVDPPSCVGTEGVAPDRLRDTANQVGTAVFAGEVTTVRRLG